MKLTVVWEVVADRLVDNAGSVELAHEEFEADDGVYDDDKHHQHGYVKEGHHGSHYRVHHHLQTFKIGKLFVSIEWWLGTWGDLNKGYTQTCIKWTKNNRLA